jgi:LDH2 family malate/lactate/ureidoglycolate dehydrogenase
MAEVRVAWDKLQEFTKEVFSRVGMRPEDAATEAEVLVWANLRGIDSHGVLRIPQYLDSVATGGMNPKANVRVEMETPAVMLVEADHAFGPVVTKWTMQRVID